VKAGSITETTAKVSATINPNNSKTTYVVEYGTTTAYGKKTAVVDIGSGGTGLAEEQTLSSLEPNTTYHFRVVATNAQAPGGVASADQEFKTLPKQGPPIVTNVKSGSITETTAKVSATINPNNSKTTYVVEYGTTTAYGKKTTAVDIGAGGAALAEERTLEGLEPGTTYHFRVVATNAQAPGGVDSADQQLKTLPKPGPPEVSEVSVLTVTETTANVKFMINPNNLDTTYVIEYGPTTSYGQKTAQKDIGSGGAPEEQEQTIAGLDPHTAYHFRVVAKNAQDEEGTKTADQKFETKEEASKGGGGGGGGSSGGGLGGGLVGGLGGVLGTTIKGPLKIEELPPPVLGKTFNIEPVSGTVLIALPGGVAASAAGARGRAHASLSKGLKFIPLTEARQIPVGSTLDTTRGVAKIATATNTPALGFGNFGAGLFKLVQQRKLRGLAEMNLLNTHSPRQVCTTLGKRATVAKHLSSKVLGRLNVDSKGKFTTKGQYSASTVRGTVWSVSNQCNGTLTHVVRGVVSVRDFRKRKTITLFTGQSYLAKAPVR
jgi:hypothetical protein